VQLFFMCFYSLRVPWSLNSGAAAAGLVLNVGSFTTRTCFPQFCIGVGSLFTARVLSSSLKAFLFLARAGCRHLIYPLQRGSTGFVSPLRVFSSCGDPQLRVELFARGSVFNATDFLD
jgi:hypothetical protein